MPPTFAACCPELPSSRNRKQSTHRIVRRVKLRDLHIALAVARSGSMTRAAEELTVSYPVVSKTISEFERTLGVKLFDRSISGAEPTTVLLIVLCRSNTNHQGETRSGFPNHL